ncbi:unnamed protein product [Clonostachys rosea]|uniref:CUE domain-containing protein n=1 Tax=Bionectria ochroleuca TaxID=29856 RepID=A0ABY6TUH7_BIOOC|nr:unnamed protein product [Clonostachys rosea]
MVSFTQIALVAPLLLGAVTAAPLPSQAQDVAVRSEGAVEARDVTLDTLETREPKKEAESKSEDSESKEEDSEKKVSKKHHKHGKKNSSKKAGKKSGKLTKSAVLKKASELPPDMTLGQIMHKFPKFKSVIESKTIGDIMKLPQVKKLLAKSKSAHGKKAHSKKNGKKHHKETAEKRDEEMIEERDEDIMEERDLDELELAMLARDLDFINEIDPRDIDADFELEVREFDDEYYY